MTVENHLRLVRKGIVLAAWVLLAVVFLQAVLGADFDGLPFLLFGIGVGALLLSLLVRLLIARLVAHRS